MDAPAANTPVNERGALRWCKDMSLLLFRCLARGFPQSFPVSLSVAIVTPNSGRSRGLAAPPLIWGLKPLRDRQPSSRPSLDPNRSTPDVAWRYGPPGAPDR